LGAGVMTGPNRALPRILMTGVPTSMPTSSNASWCDFLIASSNSAVSAASTSHAGRPASARALLEEEDAELTRAADLAARLAISPRSLERLVRSHVGLTPKWLIECRRLQHAATTLFLAPVTDLSLLAAELEYTDYPHFFRRYQRVLGESPTATRERGRRAAETANQQ
jgi:methylphosphotriester-DNA--protein-cysteine methyltransferase